MNIEFEATFIDINVDRVRKKLQKLGAKLIQSERLMRRVNFYTPRKDIKGWIRVRDEGNKITLSMKQNWGNKIEDQREVYLKIDNFDEGIKLLESLGAIRKSYQETKREEWSYKNTEVSIDTWPGLDPFVEIEAKDEETVKEVAVELGFDYSKALFGPVAVVYEKKLGILPEIINNQTPEITFENPPKPVDK